MNKIIIIFFALLIIFVGVVWKSNSDRAAREEALAKQTELHNKKMAQLEAERQAEIAHKIKEKEEAEAQRIRDKENNEKLTTSIAEAAVKSQLFDPSSAQFRNQKGNCGEVNSKNKFGGYVGFNRYIYLSSDETVAIESDSNDSIWPSSIMDDLWKKYCH
ncbi:hypothetical protein N5D44_11095 [Acinetobacter junii]|uniref:hypothetical protein n=1 Tax=Acinetobacter junii TaxID=40215 RepID=UPI002447BDCA|nr:hypothetical protein [Acinetobacter junii]MDH1858836.1 hypothetical protein [Acinetobacter junii]